MDQLKVFRFGIPGSPGGDESRASILSVGGADPKNLPQ